jgi:hypothetical protein
LAGLSFPLLILGRTVALYSLSYYYLIPLLPLVALGIATLVYRGLRLCFRLGNALAARIEDSTFLSPRTTHGVSRLGAALALLVLIAPFATMTLRLLVATRNTLPTTIDPFLVDAQAAWMAASLVNDYANEGDVVIASPAVAWQIEADVADFQMVAAADGVRTPHLPANLPASRFAFRPSYAGSRFVIVDPLWRNWAAVHVPGVADTLKELARWHLLFAEHGVEVYANPAPPPKKRDVYGNRS